MKREIIFFYRLQLKKPVLLNGKDTNTFLFFMSHTYISWMILVFEMHYFIVKILLLKVYWEMICTIGIIVKVTAVGAFCKNPLKKDYYGHFYWGPDNWICNSTTLFLIVVELIIY